MAVLSCDEWLLLARLAFLWADVHGGLMCLDPAAQVRLTEAAQSAVSEESRRFVTYEQLLRAAAATVSGCPELSHGHLQNAEQMPNIRKGTARHQPTIGRTTSQRFYTLLRQP